jgi:RNA polymerase sigma-70 factor (ECF subfamily)
MLAAAVDRLSLAQALANDDDQSRFDDAHLVNAARGGDRAAFARLHERYARMVHGIALARLPLCEAHDLVQDVFLDGLRKLHTLRDASAFGPWVATIARHLAVEFHRRRRMNQPLNAADDVPAHADADDGASDEAVRILHIIRTLPEAYSETLVLRLVEGLTGPQIAACTGMTPASVRVNLHRGMQLLREKLRLEES